MNRVPNVHFWGIHRNTEVHSPPANPQCPWPKLKLPIPLKPDFVVTPKPCIPSMVRKFAGKRYLGDLNPTGTLTFPRHRAAWGLLVSLKPPALLGIVSAEQVTPKDRKRD